MKIIEYFAIIVAVSIGMNCNGQSKEDKIIYYRQIMDPTGEISESGDTIYEVSIEVDSTELNNHRSITIIGDDWEFTASTEVDSIVNQTRFIQAGSKTRINAGISSGYPKCIVVAQTLDSRSINLVNENEKYMKLPKAVNSVIIPHPRTTKKPKKKKALLTTELTIANSSTSQ